jgi:5-oxoprolinase (ATP-hydrolysing) subunit A
VRRYVPGVTTDAVPGPTVDLNVDLGEGYGSWRMGDDLALLDVVSSASVACGFHAGDPVTMRRCVDAAGERGVAVGAHVSYFDLRGFGRRFIDVDPDELTDDVVYQLGALAGFTRVAGTRVRYVKAHGALYNRAAVDERHAAALVAAVLAYDPALPLFVMGGSVLDRLAREAGLGTVPEAFADRAYTPDGRLADRRLPGAVRHDTAEVCEAAVRIVRDGTANTVDGAAVPVTGRTLCLHGDTPGAVAHARAVRTALEAAGIVVHAPG